MNKTFIILLACTAIVLSSCKPRAAKKGEGLKGEISISGAFALYPLAVKWADEFKQLHPGVRIDISAGGAGKGMTDVLAKVVDLGMVSREVYPQEVAKGAVGIAVAKDAVVPTINANNPALADLMKTGLTRDAAIKLWITGEYKTWGDVTGTARAEAVHVYTRSDACGAAETWALWLDKKQEDLGGTAVFGDPGLATAVQKDPLGIGLNNLSYAYDEGTRAPNPGLLVLPVDVNNNGQLDPEELFYDTKDAIIQAIAEDRYPSPPARDLYLVTNGIPEKAEVIAFLKFILTKGQEFNVPAGYISLSAEKLQKGLALLPE
ncbi:MAG: PstS family phosphate ABC transporter substrate-binding protein [Odoribacteraceae bacterium]|jgi:phosphate transport system substrate-binding protein|nr:PstS family phosphate ABC transporter substrate-binding protein [Odoribacteraceae bacterium]